MLGASPHGRGPRPAVSEPAFVGWSIPAGAGCNSTGATRSTSTLVDPSRARWTAIRGREDPTVGIFRRPAGAGPAVCSLTRVARYRLIPHQDSYAADRPSDRRVRRFPDGDLLPPDHPAGSAVALRLVQVSLRACRRPAAGRLSARRACTLYETADQSATTTTSDRAARGDQQHRRRVPLAVPPGGVSPTAAAASTTGSRGAAASTLSSLTGEPSFGSASSSFAAPTLPVSRTRAGRLRPRRARRSRPSSPP